MRKDQKILIGILVGIPILCICACLVGWISLRLAGKVLVEKTMVDNPEEAAALAQSMIDYDLPPGYKEEVAIDFLFMKMVLISRGGVAANDPSQAIIGILGMPIYGIADEEEIRLQSQLQLRQAMQREKWDMRLVDDKETTIRGQEVTLYIYEGVDENGEATRQVVSRPFEGKNGQMTIVYISGSEAGWNQSEIDAFIDSIR